MPGIVGQTITLLGEINITDADAVTVDASALHGGVTVGISGQHRHFTVSGVANLTLSGLTLTGGMVPDGERSLHHIKLNNSGTPPVRRSLLSAKSERVV